jgi:hypothetical protein
MIFGGRLKIRRLQETKIPTKEHAFYIGAKPQILELVCSSSARSSNSKVTMRINFKIC